jgi:hypothetical protein
MTSTIDSGIADKMCSIVEDFTHLEATLIQLRWRMLRADLVDMSLLLNNAKMHARHLRGHLDSLGYALDDVFREKDEAEERASLKVVES